MLLRYDCPADEMRYHSGFRGTVCSNSGERKVLPTGNYSRPSEADSFPYAGLVVSAASPVRGIVSPAHGTVIVVELKTPGAFCLTCADFGRYEVVSVHEFSSITTIPLRAFT